MSAISRVLGMFLKLIYDIISGVFPSEPETISFFAMSIIISTIIIKLAVLPVSISMIKNQKKMAELKPELDKLQKKYKNDPKTLAVKQQQLYKDSNYNMLAGCLPMIIQMVVLIGFYRVFMFPAKYAFTDKAFFEGMSKSFFFIENLENIDTTMIFGVIAAISTFLVSYVSSKNPATSGQGDQGQSMMKSMMIFMPIMILWMSRKLQAGLVLYWIISNLFSLIQQIVTNKMISKDVAAEEVK
ncbi:MAG: YidC/Oxa1 family membrane protein insertase [Peptoniphilaceae bacterium]